MKNIIICSDGTGNTAIKGRGTNVFKLYEAVDLNGFRSNRSLNPQVAIYDDGVGTQSWKPAKLIGGAFGWGLARNVRDLYTALVRIYDPGDQIFLFGFSRGAFTVRTLAGMITKCGVLRWEDTKTTEGMNEQVANAYKTYRKSYRPWLGRILSGKSEDQVRADAKIAMEAFRKSHNCHDAPIRFMGVWDTVDSVGGPFHLSDIINGLVYRFKFPDYRLSDNVKSAAQAISIDDARAAFEPRLWEAREGIEQVWFAGVHSNVGGGYPKQGMSLVTLDWMLQQAEACGLRMLHTDRMLYSEHANVDDKLYDSRVGVGVFYRWKPRDMAKLMAHYKAGAVPNVHVSVLERIAHGTEGYAPGSLAPAIKVVFTKTKDVHQNAALATRSEAVERAANHFSAKNASELRLPATLVMGQAGYYGYLSGATALIIAAIFYHTPAGSRTDAMAVGTSAWDLISNAVTMQWGTVGEAVGDIPATLFWTIILLAAIAVALALIASNKRSSVFSQYWHDARQDLREALKADRRSHRAGQG